MADYQTHDARWQGIPLWVRYCANWSSGYGRIYGYDLAHLTVEAPCPLPITETGYRSHFMRADLIEAEGGPLPYVLAMLDHAATNPAWIERQAQARQLTLF